MRVLVSGHTGLLGRSFVEHALKKHWQVFGIDKQSSVRSSHPPGLREYILDITKEKDIQRLARKFQKEEIFLDGLIHFASLNPTIESLSYNHEILNQDLRSILKSLNVGVLGSFSLTKHFYGVMKNDSSILFIGSDLSLISPNQKLYCKCKTRQGKRHLNICKVKPVGYSIEKAALLGMTRYLSTFFANDKGVRVNCACIGAVDSGFDNEFRLKLSELIPLGRPARIGEYNEVFEFLLSPKSSYITGSIISVDGGRTTI